MGNDEMEKLNQQFEALGLTLEETAMPKNARQIGKYLLHTARRRTPWWESWRIVAEVERIIRAYGKS